MSAKEPNIAVVGATGAVGREFLRILEERNFPAREVRLLASSRSAGTRIKVRGEDLEVREASPDQFRGMDIAFISVNSQLSARLGPAAVEAGALVIDDSSCFRMDPDVPLVVPEVNGEDVKGHRGIISIPNCSTTPLVMVAHPLNRESPITRMIASTYQSVSGAGAAAMEELLQQSRAVLDGNTVEAGNLPRQIAFNIFPHIDDFTANGYTFEEQKMLQETRKIMHLPHVPVSATCVRVPVIGAHSAAVHLEFQQPISPERAAGLLGKMPGVKVVGAPGEKDYPTPWDVAGTDDVYVGRIRQDISSDRGLAMWVVCDNLRKGASLNAIQIAEEVLRLRCLAPSKVAASYRSV